MVLDGDSAAGTSALAYGDILVKGAGAQDGRLVDTLVLPDHVGPTIGRDGALLSASLRVAARVLDDIILHKRILGPSVDGQGAQAFGDTERAAIGDGTTREGERKYVSNQVGRVEHSGRDSRGAARVPTDTYNEIFGGVKEERELPAGMGEVDGAARGIILHIVGTTAFEG